MQKEEKKIEHRLTLTRGELKELIQDRGSAKKTIATGQSCTPELFRLQNSAEKFQFISYKQIKLNL